MFLISINKVTDPRHYFQDIAPAISQLATSAGGIFIHHLILTSDNKPIDCNEAIHSLEPLTRVVLVYFEDNEQFNRYWNSEARQTIWSRGQSYANFCDTPVEGGLPSSAPVPASTNSSEGAIPDIIRLKILGLSDRESEVLFWIAQGKSNADIADILNLSIWTVKRHIANIFDKLGVTTRFSAVVLALETMDSKAPPLQLTF